MIEKQLKSDRFTCGEGHEAFLYLLLGRTNNEGPGATERYKIECSVCQVSTEKCITSREALGEWRWRFPEDSKVVSINKKENVK